MDRQADAQGGKRENSKYQILKNTVTLRKFEFEVAAKTRCTDVRVQKGGTGPALTETGTSLSPLKPRAVGGVCVCAPVYVCVCCVRGSMQVWEDPLIFQAELRRGHHTVGGGKTFC